MKNTVLFGDTERVNQALKTVQHHEQDLVQDPSMLADNYEYERILKLME